MKKLLSQRKEDQKLTFCFLGEVVFLTDILDEAKQVMLEQMRASGRSKFEEISDPEGVADIIGLSAVVVQDLTAKRGKDYEFDWKRVTSFEGERGLKELFEGIFVEPCFFQAIPDLICSTLTPGCAVSKRR